MPRSGFVAPASALPRKRERQIGRSRNDRGCKAAPVAASVRPAPPKSMRRSRGSFSAIPAIDACRPRCRSKTAAATNREDRRRARTQLQLRDDGLRRQNSHAHSRGPDCPTPILRGKIFNISAMISPFRAQERGMGACDFGLLANRTTHNLAANRVGI